MNEEQKATSLDEDMSLDFDFEDIENQLEQEIADELADLQMLKEDREKIANPDALGKVVLNEVWNQFANQIGLDITNETLIQKYDREHENETYEDVSKKVMQDSRYKDANKKMKQQQQDGNLRDEYTGEILSQNDKANLDHTVSRKELYENQRRKQANIPTEDLANKEENLNPTNESLNKSKKDKSVDDYLKNREQREKDLREQNERANKKIDESNMSDAEKRIAKEKNNKRLQDKLNADEKRMKKKDKEARSAINKDIAKGVVKETAKKAGADALKTMAVQALFQMLKEIMNGLVRFFKTKAKSFEIFINEMKESFKRFMSKITTFLKTGATALAETIIIEIFGPIVSVFKKLASVIRQGIRSVRDAILYLKDKENANKPFSVKMAEVGKIMIAAMTGIGAMVGGQALEAVLIYYVPVLKTQIPLLGTLAGLIGMFLASVICGVVGAIVINLIDKFLASKQREANTHAQIDKGNSILDKQGQLLSVKESKLVHNKSKTFNSIKERNEYANEVLNETADEIETALENIDSNKVDIDRLLESLNEA